METDIIQVLVFALAIISLGAANLYVIARGLPQFDAAYTAFWQSVQNIAPVLRRLFNPNAALAVALKKKGLPPEIADMIAELGADMLEDMAKPYLPEKASES